MNMIVLGIETSCDETAASIVKNGSIVLSSVIASQEQIHGKFGGIVPELASRSHIENILQVVHQAFAQAHIDFDHIQGIAATSGPGLIGSLLVGLSFAKAIAFAKNIPFIGVHHIQGHLMSALLPPNKPTYPLIGLVVSGGHTNLYKIVAEGKYELLSQTQDDAAGEAFDKVAKICGLSFPGGPSIEKTALKGNPHAYCFPRPNLSNRHFSFSGLKTAVALWIQKHGIPKGQQLFDVAASFQEAVIDVLVTKSIQAMELHNIDTLAICGGVASNNTFRSRINQELNAQQKKLLLAPTQLCTDNAVMIAAAGTQLLKKGIKDSWSLNAQATIPLCNSR